jgi:hypothetical protein
MRKFAISLAVILAFTGLAFGTVLSGRLGGPPLDRILFGWICEKIGACDPEPAYVPPSPPDTSLVFHMPDPSLMQNFSMPSQDAGCAFRDLPPDTEVYALTAGFTSPPPHFDHSMERDRLRLRLGLLGAYRDKPYVLAVSTPTFAIIAADLREGSQLRGVILASGFAFHMLYGVPQGVPVVIVEPGRGDKHLGSADCRARGITLPDNPTRAEMNAVIERIAGRKITRETWFDLDRIPGRNEAGTILHTERMVRFDLLDSRGFTEAGTIILE